MLKSGSDITKELTKAKAFSSRISKLYELSLEMNRKNSVHEILDSLKGYLRWIFDFQTASISLLNSSGAVENFHLSGITCEDNALPSIVEELPSGTLQKSNGKYVSLIKNEKFCPNFPNMMMLPIKGGESTTMGSLNLAHSSKQYDQDDIRIAYLLGVQVAVAIEKARSFQALEEVNNALDDEKRKNQKLLQNTLPKSIVYELLENGKVKPKQYDSVSILFTDFEGFTEISQQLSSSEIIENLNHFFSVYDAIIHKHGLEKLKTIGDSYMCASGIPEPTPDHAKRLVNAALEIRDTMLEWENEKVEKGELHWRTRIGINSGAVVAGVIGQSKFNYDVWGNTVNIASRVEKFGKAGSVNVSCSTHHLIDKDFDCTFYKKVKNNKEQEFLIYTVEGQKKVTTKAVTLIV